MLGESHTGKKTLEYEFVEKTMLCSKMKEKECVCVCGRVHATNWGPTYTVYDQTEDNIK